MADTATRKANWGMQLEKADPRVNYRASDPQGWQCGGCRFYDAGELGCDVVEGTIDASWTCDLWTAPIQLQTDTGGPVYEAYREPLFQVFVEAFAEAAIDFTKPSWIPFLPKPGRFAHPTYGEIIVTPGQNKEMVQSVKDHVYQEHIPLDAEHETKLSGAVAWIKDMRMNDDGSADAFVEWTDRGRSLLGGGQFKYVSPEWFSSWTDPATGTVHHNIVAGGAITTRPFFKDRVLRALVANEAGTKIIKDDKEVSVPNPEDNKDPKKAAEQPVSLTMAEVEVKIAEAREADTKAFNEKIEKLTGDLTAATTLAASEKTAREALATALAAREKADRTKRFSDIAAGRGGSGDGAPWVGEAEKHVKILETLADQFGEGHESVTMYVEQQNAIAVQMKESKLFTEHGSSSSGAALNDPERKLEQMTEARMKEDPKKTHAQAYSEVLESPEGARLYGEIGTPRQS